MGLDGHRQNDDHTNVRRTVRMTATKVRPQASGEIEMSEKHKQRLEDLALRFAEASHRGVGVNAMTGMIDQALELGLNCKREYAAGELIAIGKRVAKEQCR